MGLPKLVTQFDVKNLFNDYEAYASKTPTTRYTLGNTDFEQASVNMFGVGENCKMPPLPPFSNDIVLQDLPEDLPSSLPTPATDPLSYTEAEEQQEMEEEDVQVYEDDAPLEEAPVHVVAPPSKPEQQIVQEPVVQHSQDKSKSPRSPQPTEDAITIKVKPARKTPDFYIDSIPDKVFCAPYKYDFKILFRKPKSSNEDERKYLALLREGHEQQLSFVLLDAESRQTKKVNSKGEATLVVERSKAQEEDPEDKKPSVISHVTFRVCFQTCSFHNHRKPFILRCFDRKSGMVLFETNKFNIYARKNKDKGDDWAPEGGQKMKILFDTSSPFEDIVETDEEPVKIVKSKKASKRANNKRKKVQEEEDEDEDLVESEEEQEIVEPTPPKRRRLSLEEKKKETSFKNIYHQLGSIGQQEESNVLNELESLRSN